MKISHSITARPSKLSRPKAGQRKPKALLFVGVVLLLSACAQPGKGVPLGEIFSAEVFAGSTQKGTADGRGTAAQFNAPDGIAIAPDGTIYVADTGNNRIRKITPSGEVSTFAGGTEGDDDGQGTAAQFNFPAKIAIAPDGIIYVADKSNELIRKITPSGEVSTFAGSSGVSGYNDGQGTAAQFDSPVGIAIAADGIIHVAEAVNYRIRKITPSGEVSTFAGSGVFGYNDGQGTAAQFSNLQGIAFDADGNLFVTDAFNNLIRKITPSGLVSTFAGSTRRGTADGQGAAAQFYGPRGIALDAYGNVVVVDEDNNSIRVVKPTGKVTTVFHAAADSGLVEPKGIAVTPDSSTVYITDNHRIIRMRFR